MKDLAVQSIKTEKTAHYFQHNNPGSHIQQFWIVCHGYAQKADDFLRDLEPLHRDDFLVIAPEGMHNFYRKGFAGEVVASWMTKRNRLDQIADFSVFLQKLVDFSLPQLPDNVQVNLLGFSQGCATVCRWVLAKKPVFENLILWGGLPPDDLDYQSEKQFLSDKNLYLLYGSTDPFLTDRHFSELHDLERRNEIDFDEQSFEGGHEVPPAALIEFLEKLKTGKDAKPKL